MNSPNLPPPTRHFNKCSPFNQEQLTFINFKYRELKSIESVKRAFRIKLFHKQPMCVPNILALRTIIERFKHHAAVRPNHEQAK